MKVLKEVLLDTIRQVMRFILSNLYNTHLLLNFTCPYIMFYMGTKFEWKRYEIDKIIFIPILIWIASALIHKIANKCNKGDEIPVPRKRFVRDDGNGEYSVDKERLQEMILYVADVEEYLNKKGLLK